MTNFPLLSLFSVAIDKMIDNEFRRLLKAVLPPILTQALRHLRLATRPATVGLTFAPRGWQTEVRPGSAVERNLYIAQELEQWQLTWKPFIGRLNDCQAAATDPLEAYHLRIIDHNSWITYAYVLAMAANQRSSLRILDYGGNLGYFYWIGKALLPGVALEYHCKELPEIVDIGREVTPQATWHTDDSCLDQQYNVVIFSSVLQCIQDWQGLLYRASRAARPYVFLAETPMVERVPSYVAVHRLRGLSLLHQQINKAEFYRAIADAGLYLVREFLGGEHHMIYGAPEQPRYYGFLLRRDSEAS